MPGVVHAAAAVVKTGSGAGTSGRLSRPSRRSVDAVKVLWHKRFPYMVPTSWVLLDRVPLSAAGKLDRRALPAPTSPVPVTNSSHRTGRTRELLAAVVAGLLGHDRVGVTDSFFALGDNSLSAMRLAARASDVLGVRCRSATCSRHRRCGD